MKAVTMIQICSAEDEHDSASLVRRVQEMNNILQGVQAHYAESDMYVPVNNLYAEANGNTKELRYHYHRVWDSSAPPCTGELFRTWWFCWVAMLQFELNYIEELEQLRELAVGGSSENTRRTWGSFLLGLRQQVDNAVRLLQEVRRAVQEIDPLLDLPGYPEVPHFPPPGTIDIAEQDAAMQRGRIDAIRDLAREHQKDGDLEFDPDMEVSEGDDNGAYVQGWKWVSFVGTQLDKEP